MDREVFRFVSVRAVQQQSNTDSRPEPLIFRLDRGESLFLTSLRNNSGFEQRARLVELVRRFVGSPQFIGSHRVTDRRLLAFHDRLARLPERSFAEAAGNTFKETFETDPQVFVQGGAFDSLVHSIADSIVAASLDASVSAGTRAQLARLASAVAVIEALAAGRRTFGKAEFLSTVLLLPDRLFPLPQRDSGLAGHRGSQHAARARRRADQLASLQQRSREITQGREAILELLDTIARRPVGIVRRPQIRGTGAADERGAAASGFLLTSVERDGLSGGTRTLLRNVGVTDHIDPVHAIARIEDSLVAAATTIHGTGRNPRMVRIGRNLIAGDLVADATLDIGPDRDLRRAGPCAPEVLGDAPEGSDAVTVPTGHGEARILGIADLMIVEQELARYELSEIAHIENILRKERRSRRFRTATTTEELVVAETETTEEKEKDLASTERFELQTESQRVINETASKEAGLTVHASYGPSVDVTAKLGYTSTTASQQSDRASSSYARETTSRAVNRLQTRTMERRSIKTVREVEERNLHAFDNSAGTTDISGIYRFVDKIYRAQIVNYGKRLMLEFLVPEPAAFWRYALTRQPIEPVPFVNPEPPGYCQADGRTFVPLQAADITPENYVFWASKYGAEDVEPPPPGARIVSVAKKGPDSLQSSEGNGPKMSSDAYELDIPDGYRPVSAVVNLYGETQAGIHKLVIQVQGQQFFYVEPIDDGATLNLHLEPTSKLPVSINSLRFHNYEMLVNMFCVLRREALEQWQLKTFFAITKAYEAAKARHDNAVEAARLQTSFDQSFGRHPIANREIERAELKRACISLTTGQRFDSFDAMARNVAPYGYPEIDFAEAKAEARWIELFEQGLEWNNMTYVFYPYFWGRKDGWLTLVQLADDDPLFTRFLQAGAARVQVPVRPGFDSVILNFLSGVNVWDADGNFIPSDNGQGDPLHLSIIAELKSQLGNNDVQGEGIVTLTSGSDLVVGAGTAFASTDENRRIAFGTDRYVIRAVEGPDRIWLRTPYAGTTDPAAGYSLGPRLVGEQWEVRLPTNLVKLDDFAIS